MRHDLKVITNSQLACFRRCQREHHYAYQLGYRSLEEAESLRFGALWHIGLEAWWRGDGLDAAIDAATAGTADAFEAAKLRVLLRGYDARWGGEEHHVVGVEETFHARLMNPVTGRVSQTYVLAGKIDVRLRRAFIEHKTTSEDIGMGSLYWRRLTLDPQISTYYAGAKALGSDVDRCVYDVVRKPRLRPGTVPIVDDDGVKVVLDALGERVRTKDGKKWRETSSTADGYVLQMRPETPAEYEARLSEDVSANPDAYYQRGEVVRLEQDEIEAGLDAWQLARAMREAELAERHPRNPDACQRYGRVCAYFDVCCSVASLDDTSRFALVANVHPELGEKPQAAE